MAKHAATHEAPQQPPNPLEVLRDQVTPDTVRYLVDQKLALLGIEAVPERGKYLAPYYHAREGAVLGAWDDKRGQWEAVRPLDGAHNEFGADAVRAVINHMKKQAESGVKGSDDISLTEADRQAIEGENTRLARQQIAEMLFDEAGGYHEEGGILAFRGHYGTLYLAPATPRAREIVAGAQYEPLGRHMIGQPKEGQVPLAPIIGVSPEIAAGHAEVQKRLFGAVVDPAASSLGMLDSTPYLVVDPGYQEVEQYWARREAAAQAAGNATTTALVQ